MVVVRVPEELERFFLFLHEDPEKHSGIIAIVCNGTQRKTIPVPRRTRSKWESIIVICSFDKQNDRTWRSGCFTSDYKYKTIYFRMQNNCSSPSSGATPNYQLGMTCAVDQPFCNVL